MHRIAPLFPTNPVARGRKISCKSSSMFPRVIVHNCSRNSLSKLHRFRATWQSDERVSWGSMGVVAYVGKEGFARDSQGRKVSFHSLLSAAKIVRD